jgi:hypothetical protein
MKQCNWFHPREKESISPDDVSQDFRSYWWVFMTGELACTTADVSSLDKVVLPYGKFLAQNPERSKAAYVPRT